MIKVFIPEIKGKVKTSVRGLWVNDRGILFYDYLKVKSLRFIYGQGENNSYALKELQFLKRWHKQEALFFTSGHYKEQNKGFIFYEQDKIDVLPKVLRFTIGKDRANLKGLIKRLLRDYNGLTIYVKPEGYLLEVYYK